MKIVSANGATITEAMRNIEAGKTFRYIGGSALYMMTDYRASGGYRLIVNLGSGATSGEESNKLVVPIVDAHVVVGDSLFTVKAGE